MVRLRTSDGFMEVSDKALLFYAGEKKITVIIEPGEEEVGDELLGVLVAIDNDWYEPALEQEIGTWPTVMP